MTLMRDKAGVLAAVSLSLAMASVACPKSGAQTAADQQGTAQQGAAQQSATENGTYATGQPLQMQSKEGVWGHVNPFARKKWVRRQMDPVRDRVNELDQLQARNANDIRDVDARATAGIRGANDAASLADQHANAAALKADSANSTAMAATTRTDALHGTVANLDQYQVVQSAALPFAKGRTVLGSKAKTELDAFAEKLGEAKGYVIDVQGYSQSGVQTSQTLADNVVRYLVTQHNVPVYRIYRSGLGRATAKSAPEGEKLIVNGVRVTLLQNSLATLDSSISHEAPPASPMGSMQ